MVTADPARTPTFTPFAQGDYFLSASSTTPCAEQRPRTRVPARPRSPTRTSRSRGTTAASSRRSASTWIGWVGPGIEKKRPDRRTSWTDHTDIRPTMLALLGLKDDYVSDGRVVTEFLKGDASRRRSTARRRRGPRRRPTSRSTRRSAQFSMDTLCASTGALASNTSGDTTYADTESALAVSSARERDALADRSGSRSGTPSSTTRSSTRSRRRTGSSRPTTCSTGPRRSRRSSSRDVGPEGAREDQAHRGHLRGEPQLRQPVRRLGGRERPAQRRPTARRPRTQVNQAGNAYACLKQDDVNLTSPPLPTTCTDRRRTHGITFASHFTNTSVHDRRLHPADGRRRARRSARVRVRRTACRTATGGGAAGRLHARPGARFYQEQYQLHGGTQDRYVSGSDATGLTMGYYDTTQLPLYKYLHDEGPPATTRSPTTSSRRRSAGRSSTTSG